MAFADEHPDYRILHADLRDMADVTTRQTYDKGGWILHMLRNRIGDDAWWRGIRAYYAAHRNGTAVTADFQRAMESACACSLADFLDYWLTTGSHLRLDGDWQYDAEKGTVHIALEHRGPTAGSPAMTLEAAVYYDDSPLPEIVTVPITERGGEIRFDGRSRPRNILLDPNTRLLAAWTFAERRP